jgi:integrase
VSSPTHVVKVTRLANGERFALLLDGRTRMPIAEITRYSVAVRRTKEGSVSTMVSDLRAIAVALSWAARSGVDIDRRIETATFFDHGELVSLKDALRERRRAQDEFAAAGSSAVVGSATHYSRCVYVRDYLAWRAERVIHRIHDPDRQRHAVDHLQAFKRAFSSLLPRSRELQREGLPEQVQQRFRQIIHPKHPENPFQEEHRHRNYALLLLYFELGVRLSEALVIKGRDLDLRPGKATVTIHRRADDPEDSRVDQPLTKTLPRIIPIGEELCVALTTYILQHRSRYPGAKKQPYIFVARSGRPIARRTVADMFQLLRNRCSELPSNLTAHVLRHSWNDRFSALADEQLLSAAEEMKTRSYLQGWRESSGTAARYTKRYTRQQAERHILELQRKSASGRVR